MSCQDVIILNPWDSQGNQIADSAGIYPTIRGCGGGGISKDTYFIERKMRMTYQKVTGTLMANSHPGSYCGQDAYNNMLVTENELLHRKRSSRPTTSANESRSIELYARSASNYARGGYNMDTAVRRLTPLECERLQGFPDNWTLIGEPEVNEKTGETEYFYIDTNGKRKKVSDSARYKALGNTIALPFWQFLARRIVAQYERDITMGSLFDGICGFPFVFKRCGAKPLWTSEIEEFPIAVCKAHFGDEDAGTEGDISTYL